MNKNFEVWRQDSEEDTTPRNTVGKLRTVGPCTFAFCCCVFVDHGPELSLISTGNQIKKSTTGIRQEM